MTETMFDCIVVGAGVIGSATAYYLAKERKYVALFDQVQQTQYHLETLFYKFSYRKLVYFAQTKQQSAASEKF